MRSIIQQALFKDKLAEYLRIAKESPALLHVWFWDESGFTLRVIRRKNWCKKGTRSKKKGERRKGRINVMGGVRYSDKKRWVDFIPSGNATNFYAVLKNFYGDLREQYFGQFLIAYGRIRVSRLQGKFATNGKSMVSEYELKTVRTIERRVDIARESSGKLSR